jgi:hypothetical protein
MSEIPAESASDESLPVFPEAHRGEWLESDAHYMQVRAEHQRRLAAEYEGWRSERAAAEAGRRHEPAPEDRNPDTTFERS